MSVKSLAPFTLGIGALYVFSSKGSPFNQRHDTGIPGGEDVGPPKPETDTPRRKTQDARRKTQDARRKTQDARRKTQDARRPQRA